MNVLRKRAVSDSFPDCRKLQKMKEKCKIIFYTIGIITALTLCF